MAKLYITIIYFVAGAVHSVSTPRSPATLLDLFSWLFTKNLIRQPLGENALLMSEIKEDQTASEMIER